MKGRGLKAPMTLVPMLYRNEVNKLSKAALADMAWDLAAQCCESADDVAQVLAKFRANWEAVKLHRSQANR